MNTKEAKAIPKLPTTNFAGINRERHIQALHNRDEPLPNCIHKEGLITKKPAAREIDSSKNIFRFLGYAPIGS